jgi:Transposase, Mutator family
VDAHVIQLRERQAPQHGELPERRHTVIVHGLIAVGVNADGHREILGFDVTSAEDGAGWLAFFRGLVTAARRCGAGDLRRALLAGRPHPRHPSRRRLAKMPHPLPAGSANQGDQGQPSRAHTGR